MERGGLEWGQMVCLPWRKANLRLGEERKLGWEEEEEQEDEDDEIACINKEMHP